MAPLSVKWWYDQQSAEDQALIDAGELDYPESYKAANFVDTFALGENTSLDLVADTGVAAVKGLSFSKGSTNLSAVDYSGFYYSSGQACAILVNKPASADADFKLLRLVPQLYDNENKLNIDAGNVIYLDCVAPKQFIRK